MFLPKSTEIHLQQCENQSNLRLKAVRQPFLGSGTMYAVAYAIEGLHQMPGRKAIALFSDGSLPGVSNVVEMANRASVVIYTLDPRGVTSFSWNVERRIDRAAYKGHRTFLRRSSQGHRSY